MKALAQLLVPLLISATALAARMHGADIYEAMTAGARKGLLTLWSILPALLVVFPMIRLLEASGLPTLLDAVLGPVFRLLGVPEETGLLMLLRPLSGSAALAAASELMQRHGPDSLIGRTAAVMLGSSSAPASRAFTSSLYTSPQPVPGMTAAPSRLPCARIWPAFSALPGCAACPGAKTQNPESLLKDTQKPRPSGRRFVFFGCMGNTSLQACG